MISLRRHCQLDLLVKRDKTPARGSPVSIHRIGSCLDFLDVQDLQGRLQNRAIDRRVGEEHGRDGIGSKLVRHDGSALRLEGCEGQSFREMGQVFG